MPSVEDFLSRWEKKTAPVEIKNPREYIQFREDNPKQIELFKAAGLWDWYNGGELRSAVSPVIGYGGAAFGGKTYGTLILPVLLAYAYPGIQIGYFRRTYAELDGPDAAMSKAAGIFAGLAKSRDSGKHWHFPEVGSDFYFRHCEHEKDRFKYQSQDMDVLITDQAEHFSWIIINYLLTRNRVTSKVETRGVFKPFAVLTANPGNIGHMWYMNLFDIDEEQALVEDAEKGTTHMQVKHVKNPNGQYQDIFFIPAFMDDNKVGLERDPEYPDRLKQSDPDLYEALCNGDWGIFSGQAFREFSKDAHVCDDFPIPWNWPKWRAVDWGWDHPFYCCWLARDPLTKRVYVYREVTGQYMTDQEQAFQIAQNTPHTEVIPFTFADPSMWTKKNMMGIVKSTFDEYYENGVILTKADNDRVRGKKKIHSALADLPDGEPGLKIFSSCPQLITVLPKLSRAELNPEDVEKQDGDDPYDALRYGYSNIDLFKEARKKKKKGIHENPWNLIGDMI